jgi:hypothetical protein
VLGPHWQLDEDVLAQANCRRAGNLRPDAVARSGLPANATIYLYLGVEPSGAAYACQDSTKPGWQLLECRTASTADGKQVTIGRTSFSYGGRAEQDRLVVFHQRTDGTGATAEIRVESESPESAASVRQVQVWLQTYADELSAGVADPHLKPAYVKITCCGG